MFARKSQTKALRVNRNIDIMYATTKSNFHKPDDYGFVYGGCEMPDRVEDILKEIHVLFAKCEQYGDSTDLIIVSREKMFELLERLNEELGAVLDRYEATTLSRERARLDMEREKAGSIAAAKQAADDIHAASLVYTDSMLESIDRVFETTKYQIKHDMLEAIAKIEDQSELLMKNREGVKAELAQMHDSEIYLTMLESIRKKAEEKRMLGEELTEEDIYEESKPAAQKLDIRVNKPGENSGVTFSTRRSRKKNNKPAAAEAPAEHEEGAPYSADEFDLDNEYFAWQEEQEGGEAEEKPKKKGWFRRK